jgi:pimeloyl-ACP methyl ester carboxylesterase
MANESLRRPSYDQRVRIRSRDGWPLAIYEYLPRGAPHGPPVLCIHGLTCRYGIFDGGDGFGIAPYLAQRGHHVFAADLRGRGLSLPRSPWRRLRALWSGWTLRDFLDKDVPTLFEYVLARAESHQLDVLAHSLGGMLTLDLLSRTADPRVRRLVAIGSGDATAMMLPLSREQRLERARSKVNLGVVMAPLALSARYAPVHWLARVAARSPALARTHLVDPALGMMLNVRNMDEDVLQTFLTRAMSGMSARKYWSFGELYRRVSRRGAVPPHHHHPILLIAGAHDRLVPLEKARETLTRCTHPQSRLLELSRNRGHTADYGHVDLLLGKLAASEVFPHIEAFLTEADRAQRAQNMLTTPTTQLI